MGREQARLCPALVGRRFPSEGGTGFGDPASQILADAEAFGADTIVVTTGTRSALKRTLLGSVAEETLRRARVGVLMYWPPA